jgi:hypothetical protein
VRPGPQPVQGVVIAAAARVLARAVGLSVVVTAAVGLAVGHSVVVALVGGLSIIVAATTTAATAAVAAAGCLLGVGARGRGARTLLPELAERRRHGGVVVAVISEVDFAFDFNQSVARLLQARHISARRLDVRARFVNYRCGDETTRLAPPLGLPNCPSMCRVNK